VDEVGTRIAESVVGWFSKGQHIELIERLRIAGLKMESGNASAEGATDQLKGSTFVISGTFKNFSRDGLKADVELRGGKIASSISAKTSYLIAGESTGPSKMEKALQLKIKVISEDEYLQLTN
jgi:DNA ligase (NAD+)